MRRLAQRLLWIAAFALAFTMLWRKVRIVFWVHLTFWQLLLLFFGLALGIYLLIDALFSSGRGE